ncbi:MAG: 2-polyprenyl-3-methyl-6-methoxy-1,4-benzoquinone monooxygenase [Pseudomonadota bacterium]
MNRHFSFVDTIFIHADLARKTLWVQPKDHQRTYPAKNIQENHLSEKEKKHAAGLMRVNHAGEVCAQALYQGQAMTARSYFVKEKMQEAADEELDHLAWCNQRLYELNSHTSYLNLVWYCGAFSLGFIAGMIGDRWSLGFLAETEEQVVRHLESHLGSLPQEDVKSRVIVEQMHDEESQHRDMAFEAGAANLPEFIKRLMTMSSKIMTRAAYFL